MSLRRGPDPFEAVVASLMRRGDPTLAALVASLVTAHDAADSALDAYALVLTRAGKTADMDGALALYFADEEGAAS